jgi:hypothetical protein
MATRNFKAAATLFLEAIATFTTCVARPARSIKSLNLHSVIMLLVKCICHISRRVPCLLQDGAVLFRAVHLLHSHHLPGVVGPHDAEDEGLQFASLSGGNAPMFLQWPCTVCWCSCGAQWNMCLAWRVSLLLLTPRTGVYHR